MKYKVEGNVDFFNELTKEDDTITNSCLITGEPLTYNSITLVCNHSFNYESLYKELYNNKLNRDSKLSVYQIACPYCRQVTNNILPYVPGFKKIVEVNHPKTYCMQHHTCMWKFKNGKRKGNMCCKPAFQSDKGFFCESHWKILVNNDAWTSEMESLYKSKNIVEMRELAQLKGCKISGTKRQLVMRIVQNEC